MNVCCWMSVWCFGCCGSLCVHCSASQAISTAMLQGRPWLQPVIGVYSGCGVGALPRTCWCVHCGKAKPVAASQRNRFLLSCRHCQHLSVSSGAPILRASAS